MAIETLAQDRAEKQARLEQLKLELSRMDEQADPVQRQTVTEGINTLTARIAELDDQLKRIDEKADGEEITFSVPGVDFKQLPAEVIKLIEKVVRADRRRIYAEVSLESDKLHADYRVKIEEAEAKVKEYIAQVDSLQEINRTSKEENARLVRENGEYRDSSLKQAEQIKDLEKKLKNSAEQLEEKAAENKRLESELMENRAATHFGERKAQQIIDVTPAETEEMNKLIVSINHVMGNWHEVIREDGSKITVHEKDLAQYQSQEKVQPFRDKADNQSNTGGNELSTSGTTEAVVEDQFRVKTAALPAIYGRPMVQGNELAEGKPDGETPATAAGFVTKEELEERLKRFVQEHGLISA